MPTSFGFDRKIYRPVLRMSRRRRSTRVLKNARRCGYKGGRRKQSREAASKAVAERLEALRNLIPPKNDGVKEREAAADRLFEETADYILLLRTQVEVLKRLVDVYSPCIDDSSGSA
ncbi:unnamed protein product [Musa banksii]